MHLGILGVLAHPLVQRYREILKILEGQAGLSDQGFQEILKGLVHPGDLIEFNIKVNFHSVQAENMMFLPLAQEFLVIQILVSQHHLWVPGTLVLLGFQAGQVGLVGRSFLSLQELL